MRGLGLGLAPAAAPEEQLLGLGAKDSSRIRSTVGHMTMTNCASYPTAILKSHAIPVLRNITPGIWLRAIDIHCSVYSAPRVVVASHVLCSNWDIAWGL